MRFKLNAHKSWRIFFESPHHNLIQYINPWWNEFLRYVHVTCFFHLTHAKEPIIILIILLIGIDKCQKYTFKNCPWHIIIKSEGHTFRYIYLLCWPPVPPVENSNTSTNVETTTKPPDKLSKVHWIFQKLIGFGDEYLF